MNAFSTLFPSRNKTNSSQAQSQTQLQVEALEERMMLSTVEVIAAGTQGGEQVQLQIDGVGVSTFTTGSGADARDFESFFFFTDNTITADNVTLEFLNDSFNAATGADSNLVVDAIVVDGVRTETESAGTFSTGTFLAADGIQPGFRQSETLHANGSFQFSGNGGGSSSVQVRARGDEGGEQFNVLLNGQVAATFTTTTAFQNYTFNAGFNVDIADVDIEFFGDVFDASQGIDTNLDVNFVRIDGVRYDTEASTTFSTGTFLAADGIQPGFRQSETLHANGIFSFFDPGNGSTGNGSDNIQILARGDEGGERFLVFSNDVLLGDFTVITEFQNFEFNTNDYTPGSDLRIEYVDDIFDPANGIDTNLIVDSVTINGDTRQVEDASTFGFGTFIDSIGGFAEGFNQSETLHSDGFFVIDFSNSNTGGGGGGGGGGDNGGGNPGNDFSEIAFEDAGAFRGVVNGAQIIDNPTSLQFGPDGRLYVSEQNGTINAFTVAFQNGEYVATDVEVINAITQIQNHNDDGSLNGNTDRQVTGIVVTGTANQPVIYVSSSDPRISFNGEVNLDTNSGTITRLTRVGNSFQAVDIIRGLPRSEENHANNGLVLSNDGNFLYVAVGGNTNNGAPSQFFSFTSEYVLSGTILEIDLNDINSRQILSDFGPGQNGRQYIYDLPTLDDPNTPNITDGVGEDANGNDEAGPFGGNDGLNQAILPADAPLRVFADGLRNPYDLVITRDGNLYTVDNGSNGGLGGDPVVVNGQATNQPNGGGTGDPEPLFLVEEGDFFGHPNPTRSNQDGSLTVLNDNGNPDNSLAVNFVSNLADRVPDGVNIQDGFLIDPSRFTGNSNRLALSGTRVERDSNQTNALLTLGSSSNGLVEYVGGAFGGQLDGDLLVAQFNGNITRLDLTNGGFSATSEAIPGLSGLSTPLDVTVGPNGTIFVAEIGGDFIRVFQPTGTVTGFNTDIDGDGLVNAVDPFSRDSSNGTQVILTPGSTLQLDFDANQDGNLIGANGFGGGLTGVAVNGVTDFEQFFQQGSSDPNQDINLDNVKFTTAAGGGTTVIENVSNGDAFLNGNNGEFLFQTGLALADNVNTLNVQWTVFNPGSDVGTNFQQIGGFLGTGDQSNYLKFVAISHPAGEFEIVLEENDEILSSDFLQANNLFSVPDGSRIFLNLSINVNTGIATPTATYETGNGNTTVSGPAVDLGGTAVLDAIRGDFFVQGQNTGLAVGLFSSNTSAPPESTFTAIFDDISISGA